MTTKTNVSKKQQGELVKQEGWTVNGMPTTSDAVANNYNGCATNGLNTKNNGFYFVETQTVYVYKSGNEYYELRK